MGRRPISFGQISPRVDTQERLNLILGHQEGGITLRARCARCDHTSGELQPATPPSTAPPSRITHQLAWCHSRLFAAALGELGPRLENAILDYVILQHSLCRRARFSSPAAGMLRTERRQHAAWISVVRVSTRRSFAPDEGSLLQGALCT